MCKECYVEESRITPLRNANECLENHLQYVCGTCGRCICIDEDPTRKVQRWNFPFQTLAAAKMYLRTADYSMKKSCGIYEIVDISGRISYKIFSDQDHLKKYLQKNKKKKCRDMQPQFVISSYTEFENTKVKILTKAEIKKYMSER